MSAWKIRRLAHDEAPELAATVSVFVAPTEGQTFQNTGQLKLTKAEADELQSKLTGPAPVGPLTATEYNRLHEFLMEWAEQDSEAKDLSAIVRAKLRPADGA